MFASLGAAAAVVQSFFDSASPGLSSHYNGPIAHGGVWRDAYLRADMMISNMTLEERVNLTTAVFGPCPSNSGGVPRLGIPGMCFDDGRECERASE
jgi:beta-glucosidase